ncbi:MAG TPA: hypothetical protein VJV22_02595 [Acidobacteriaceae bacterium]|nr:hypothetical protein [Acidobacteriaceae bacterium]
MAGKSRPVEAQITAALKPIEAEHGHHAANPVNLKGIEAVEDDEFPC